MLRPEELKAITQDELIQFITLIFEKNGEFPSQFDWNDELAKKGFKPEFVNIDFKIINDSLAKNGIVLGQRLAIWNGRSYINMNFIDCKELPFRGDCYFEHCTFERCTIVDKKILKCVFDCCQFKNVEINEAEMNRCEFINCSICQCRFVNSTLSNIETKDTRLHLFQNEFVATHFTNVSGLVESDYPTNIVDIESSFSGSTWDTLFDKGFEAGLQTDKPIIIMLYSPADGVTNAVKMIEFYKKYDVNLVLITPDKGMSHPILGRPELISGIILPGGPDVPQDDKDIRKKFELELLNLACALKIPTLGICRGHQLIGSRFGGTIKTITGHTEHVIHVKPKEGSRLHERLQRKYEKFKKNEAESGVAESTHLSKDQDDRFTYHSTCAHHQALFFDKSRDKSVVKIVAKAVDKLPEALQINDHIITYQHHHEAFYQEYPDANKVAKTLLKQYLEMVKEYHLANQNKEAIKPT